MSLGLVLDASGSMQGERMNAARAAIHRLLFERSHPRDELFFVEFGFNARLTQEWTSDRQLLRGALQDVQPTGDTALYDAVALAVPTAQAGRHRKKVLLVISDGRDTHSVLRVKEIHDIIVASDVLVYALGFEKWRRRRAGSRDGADPEEPSADHRCHRRAHRDGAAARSADWRGGPDCRGAGPPGPAGV